MELLLLGTGTAIPHVERSSPGAFVKAGSSRILFDTGSGTLRRLSEAGISYLDIDQVFFTHFHPDHTGDLVPLLFASRNALQPRAKKLILGGPPGLEAFYRGLLGVYGEFIEAGDYDLGIVEIQGSFEARDFLLLSHKVPHTENSFAYRISSEGKSLVLSGDTGYSEDLVEFSRDADLLLCECSFRDDMEISGHLTPRLAGRIAREAGARRLVLTHFYPVFEDYDIEAACRKEYRGEVAVGRDLMKFIV
jgi:ribonuclease BN (tRNA processing enzyme)